MKISQAGTEPENTPPSGKWQCNLKSGKKPDKERELSIMNRKSILLGFFITALAISAAAQTTVTTSGTTSSGTVPVFNGTATVTNSPISVSGSNVGIGTTSPGSPLSVNGAINAGGNYYNALSFSFNGDLTNGIKIKTNIPYISQGTEMPTIVIEGYNYGSALTIGLAVSWYVYAGEFYNYTASSY